MPPDTQDTPTKKVKYTFDPKTGTHNLPEGWTISDIGSEGYLVTHDGTKDDGTVGPGCAFKTHNLDDLPVLIEHRGRIPVGHPNNPHPE